MITVLTGQNFVGLERELASIVQSFDGQAEYIDGADLTRELLSDLARGLSLFSDQRLVIIRRPSDSDLWKDIADWLSVMADSATQFILVDSGLDKRTKTYKQLQKHADLKQFDNLNPYRQADAYKFAADEAKRQSVKLTNEQTRLLVDRVGIDAPAINQAISKLGLYPEVTDDLIVKIIDASPDSDTFRLLELALNKDFDAMQKLLADLRTSQEPHMLFGALTYQVLVLGALVFGQGKPTSQIADDFGIKEFAMRGLIPYANNQNINDMAKLLKKFADTEEKLKSSSSDNWTMIEKLLVEICSN